MELPVSQIKWSQVMISKLYNSVPDDCYDLSKQSSLFAKVLVYGYPKSKRLMKNTICRCIQNNFTCISVSSCHTSSCSFSFYPVLFIMLYLEKK